MTPESPPEQEQEAGEDTASESVVAPRGAADDESGAGAARAAVVVPVPDQRVAADAHVEATAGAASESAGEVAYRVTLGERLVDWRWRMVDRVLDPSPGLVFTVVYVGVALYVTWGLFRRPDAGVLQGNPYDQYYFEWQLAAVQHALFHFGNPLFSHGMNAPDGVNVAGNPQIIGPAVVLSPVTAVFGAPVSFMLLTVFNLAATAGCWRWFLRRNVARGEGAAGETAAFVGGLFLGFSPSMMSHSLAHPNLAGQWLVPLIVDRVLRLRSEERLRRNAIVLGLLIAAQVFVGEELLFLTALALGFFVVAYAVMAPRQVRREGLTFLRGAGIAVATAVAVLAYPLYFQFLGPGSFKGIPFDIGYYSADLKSWAVYPSQELWGDTKVLDPLAPGFTEQAALLGWALLVVLAALSLWMIRSAAVRAALIAGGLLVLLSLGPTPVFDHKPLPSPFGPDGVWQVIGQWPLFSSALPIRNALAVTWLVGVLLTLGLERALRHRYYWLRGMVVGALVTALVPLIPRPFDVEDRPRIPAFFTTDMWRTCLPLGHTIVGVPMSSGGDRTNLTWATATDAGFDIPQGPAMAPNSPTDKQVVFGREAVLWTAQWLKYIMDNGGGATPPITPAIQAQVAADLTTWHAGCVVVADDNWRLPDLRTFLNGTMGPAVEMGGVWVWKASATAGG